MSAKQERALKLINEMLHIVDCADKHAGSSTQQSSKVDNFDWKYLTEVKDNYAGKTFRVTEDIKILEQAWKDAELGPHDELKPYCGAIGLCIQVEEEDNTLQLRWENMDTCWIPARACASAGDLKPTVPRGIGCDWLPPPGLEQCHEDEQNQKEEEKQNSDVKEELFEGVEDDYVKTNAHVQITRNMKTLEHAWKEAELGPNDELKPYLGCVGKIMAIEEDDDTVQLRWANLDTAWFPIKACLPAPNQELSVPRQVADWLTPDGIKDDDNDNETPFVEQTNATDEYYKQKQAESEQQ